MSRAKAHLATIPGRPRLASALANAGNEDRSRSLSGALAPAVVASSDNETNLPSGGPRTAEGRAVARCNAVKHGLCAPTLLPDVLQPGRVELFRGRLTQLPQRCKKIEELENIFGGW